MPIPFRLDHVVARLSESAAPSAHPPARAPEAAASRAAAEPSRVARLLGLTRAQLRLRLERYGLTEG
jgi:hypothetical protein